MGIRESLGRHSGAVTVGTSLLVLVCIGLIVVQLRGHRKYDMSRVGQEFYSADDGASWFLADASKGSPFNDNGTQAYRALVFRCGSGQPFVAYLAKYSAEQQARWQAEAAAGGGQTRVVAETPQVVKKPGDSTWRATPAGMEYPPVLCPDGGDNAVIVSHFDPASGTK